MWVDTNDMRDVRAICGRVCLTTWALNLGGYRYGRHLRDYNATTGFRCRRKFSLPVCGRLGGVRIGNPPPMK